MFSTFGRRLRFDGWIAGVGTASGVRIVVGCWSASPFGPFADVMVEEPDGRRMLVAPSPEIGGFVAGTYRFDRVLTADVRVERAASVIRVEAGPLSLSLVTGRRTLRFAGPVSEAGWSPAANRLYSCRVHAYEGAEGEGRRILQSIFDIVGELKHRADARESPGTVFLLRHMIASPHLRVSDLAECSRLDVSTVSRHVRALEDAGHLTRVDDPDDRRASRLVITDQGRALLEAAMGVRGSALAEGMADWSPEDRAALADLLDRLARSLDRAPLATEHL